MPEIARLHRRGELRFGGQVDGSGPGCVSGRDQYAVLKDIRSPDGIEVLGAEFHRVVAAADTEVERAAGNERLREHRNTGSETSEHRDAAGKKGTEGTAGENLPTHGMDLSRCAVVDDWGTKFIPVF